LALKQSYPLPEPLQPLYELLLRFHQQRMQDTLPTVAHSGKRHARQPHQIELAAGAAQPSKAVVGYPPAKQLSSVAVSHLKFRLGVASCRIVGRRGFDDEPAIQLPAAAGKNPHGELLVRGQPAVDLVGGGDVLTNPFQFVFDQADRSGESVVLQGLIGGHMRQPCG